MGSLSKEPLASLVKQLKYNYNLSEFVETGTYLGISTAFAAGIFDKVTTIEINDRFRRRAMESYPDLPISFLLGDSRRLMYDVMAGLTGPALIWLDGHAGGGNYGELDDCPLLAELAAITASPHHHFILIDDARGFLAPPPPPFDADKWPTITEVFEAIQKSHPYYCVVIEDTIICVPSEARKDIVNYCTRVRPKI
jgi:hypothetical protein